MDFNAVVLTTTGREKTTAALVSLSLIAIHVNAKTVSLFLMHPFFSHRYLPIISGSISGRRFPVSMSYAEPFSFFDVFRSRISRNCEGVSRQPPPAPAADVLIETDRRCYNAGSLHDVLRCRSSTEVLQQ